jgi:hypothetical protein
MNDLRLSRTTAGFALLITVIAIVYTAACAVTGWEPSLGWLVQSVIHAGELAAVVALALSGAAGPGRVARIGLGTAMLGQAVLTVAEPIWPGDPDLGDALFGVGPVLTGIGLLVAGIAVVRAGRWAGTRRFVPVAVGTYVLAVMIPVVIGSGGPPAPAALWAICGWDLLWLLLAVSVLTEVAVPDLEEQQADR